MFASNQILEISGNLSFSDQLENSLEFALKYSENDKIMLQSKTVRGCKLVYQITEDGKYCIGWAFRKIPIGWHEYSFDFDIKIVSEIIRQHLKNFPTETGYGDGSYENGFIMKCINKKSMTNEEDGIKSPFYCIVYFKPYTCFYSK